MKAVRLAFALAPAAWLAAGPAAAQFEDEADEPVEITADVMEWMDNERIAIARGAADAVQGRYRLFADVLTAYLAERGAGEDEEGDDVRLIEAEGNVRLVTPDEVASGATGAYDIANRQVTLEGDVVLMQGESVARGGRLEMDLDTGVSRLLAAPGTGRVTAILVPRSGDDDSGDDDSGDDSGGDFDAAPGGEAGE